MKFKVGDRVVATTKFYPGFKGKVGTVVEVEGEMYEYGVKFDFQKQVLPFGADELAAYNG